MGERINAAGIVGLIGGNITQGIKNRQNYRNAVDASRIQGEYGLARTHLEHQYAAEEQQRATESALALAKENNAAKLEELGITQPHEAVMKVLDQEHEIRKMNTEAAIRTAARKDIFNKSDDETKIKMGNEEFTRRARPVKKSATSAPSSKESDYEDEDPEDFNEAPASTPETGAKGRGATLNEHFGADTGVVPSGSAKPAAVAKPEVNDDGSEVETLEDGTTITHSPWKKTNGWPTRTSTYTFPVGHPNHPDTPKAPQEEEPEAKIYNVGENCDFCGKEIKSKYEGWHDHQILDNGWCNHAHTHFTTNYESSKGEKARLEKHLDGVAFNSKSNKQHTDPWDSSTWSDTLKAKRSNFIKVNGGTEDNFSVEPDTEYAAAVHGDDYNPDTAKESEEDVSRETSDKPSRVPQEAWDSATDKQKELVKDYESKHDAFVATHLKPGKEYKLPSSLGDQADLYEAEGKLHESFGWKFNGHVQNQRNFDAESKTHALLGGFEMAHTPKPLNPTAAQPSAKDLSDSDDDDDYEEEKPQVEEAPQEVKTANNVSQQMAGSVSVAKPAAAAKPAVARTGTVTSKYATAETNPGPSFKVKISPNVTSFEDPNQFPINRSMVRGHVTKAGELGLQKKKAEGTKKAFLISKLDEYHPLPSDADRARMTPEAHQKAVDEVFKNRKQWLATSMKSNIDHMLTSNDSNA